MKVTDFLETNHFYFVLKIELLWKTFLNEFWVLLAVPHAQMILGGPQLFPK